jgi:hypothetical protein
MYFLDLKKRTIVELNEKWSVQTYNVNCNEILDMRPEDAYRKIEKILAISFKERTVLINFTVEDVESQDDFEIICDILVSRWIYRNAKKEMRLDSEKRLAVPDELIKRVNADYTSLKYAIDNQYHNRYFTIQIKSKDGNYKYDFINEGE